MKKAYHTIGKGLIAAALCATALPCATATAAEIEGWGDFKLFLDPGHSARENQGLWGYSEAEKTVRVALSIKEYLTTYTDMPEECIMLCREDDNTVVDLEERSDMANAWGADFFYSIHSDAAASTNTTLTMYGGWKKDGEIIEKTPNGGKAFGEILNPNLTGVMRITTRGNYADRCYYDPSPATHANQYPYLSVNRRSNMASLLSEGGYHTIASQQQLNINDDYKRLEGFAAFRSILGYRGLECPVQTFLAGIITNSENNVPINGVTVTADGKTYTTDTWESVFNKYTNNPDLIHNGFYLFEGIDAGKEVEVTFAADGYDPVTKTVTIKSAPDGTANDNVTWLDVAMTSNAPAKVESISIDDFTSVSPVYPIVLTFSRNMDRASVEEGFSIDNDGKVGLSWDNDYTLNIDISELVPNTKYTIRIDGSTAKNSQTGQLLDGNGDGTGGDDYVLEITMAEPDLTPATVVSTDPAADSEVEYNLRPVVRIEYSEPLNWNEDTYADFVTVKDKEGNTYAGTLTHTVIGERSVLHYYFNEDLPLDKCFLVTVKEGLADLSGNLSDEYNFRFLSEYRGIEEQETVLALDDVSGFWAPDGSGSSAGLTQEANSIETSGITASKESSGSLQLNYSFDPMDTGGAWMIREYYSSGASTVHDNIDGILSFWVYGDGSNNKVSVRIRANGASGGIKYRDPETVLDFRGWKHVAWDLANDPYLAFTGADELTGDWRLDSFFLTHQNTDNTPDVPQQSWEGVILFDELEFNKFDASAVRTASISDIELPQGGIQQNGCDGISVIRAGQTLKISADGNIANVEIYNASGSKVISTSPNSGNAEIQLGGLGNGVYIAKVTADNAAKTVKFVK